VFQSHRGRLKSPPSKMILFPQLYGLVNSRTSQLAEMFDLKFAVNFALKNLPYKDRLKACNMSNLHYRRVRGDMIEIYKILSGKYDSNVVPYFNRTGMQATRGIDLRIFKTRFKYNLRKLYFTNRVLDVWNSLPDYIVTANNTNIFKRRVDNQYVSWFVGGLSSMC